MRNERLQDIVLLACKILTSFMILNLMALKFFNNRRPYNDKKLRIFQKYKNNEK